jgi:hypothetical protein
MAVQNQDTSRRQTALAALIREYHPGSNPRGLKVQENETTAGEGTVSP